MWKLLQPPFEVAVGAEVLDDDAFFVNLLSKNYYVSQVRILKCIVSEHRRREGDLKTFDAVCAAIHFRLGWLDFDEVFGALNVLNGLFDACDDEFMSEKLATNVFATHLQKMVQNKRFWKVTQLSVLMLSELCSNNEVVRQWIVTQCGGALFEIGEWCKQNPSCSPGDRGRDRDRKQKSNHRKPRNHKQSNHNQSNVQFWKFEPHFQDKKQAQSWRQRATAKVQSCKNQSLVQAFETINKR